MNFRAMLLCGALSAVTLPAADTLTEEFQRALFEEEANRNLPAAIAGYEAVVKRLDEQRQLAATAVFRMGESYRKLGKTNEAVLAYERIIKEFADQETLVKLSGQNLNILRPKESPSPSSTDPELSRLIELRREMWIRLQQLRDQYTEEHPSIREATKDIQVLDSQIQQLMSGRGLKPMSMELAELRQLEILLETVRSLEPMSEAEIRTLNEIANDSTMVTLAETWNQAKRNLEAAEAHLQRFPDSEDAKGAVNGWRGNVHSYEASLRERRETALRMLEARVEAARRLAGREWSKEQSTAASQLDPATRARQKELLEQEIALVEGQLKEVRKQVDVGVVPVSEPIGKERELLNLRRRLAALDESPDAIKRQRELVDQEMMLVRQLVETTKMRVENGKASRNDLVELERQMLQLMREDLDLAARPPRSAAATSESTMTAEEAEELRRVQGLVANSPDLINEPLPEPGNPGSAREYLLRRAVRRGWINVVDELLRNGAKMELGPERSSILGEAAAAGHLGIVERLITAGASLNPQGGNYSNPLLIACESGYAAVAIALIRAGADVNLPGYWSSVATRKLPLRSPLAVANAEISRHLLNRGAMPDGASGSEPPIVTAGGDTEKLELLLAHKAKPGVTNSAGETALHYAARFGNGANVRRLLALGLDPNARDGGGVPVIEHCLHRAFNQHESPAVRSNYWDVVVTLIEAGSNVRAKLSSENGGVCPLHIASRLGDLKGVNYLIQKGAEVNARAEDGHTAMHVAAAQDQADAIRALVEAKADVNAQDSLGDTPLHFAAMTSSLAAAKALVEAGADRTIKNRDGRIPASCVRKFAGPGTFPVDPVRGLPSQRPVGNRVAVMPGTSITPTYEPFRELLGVVDESVQSP